jgi:hypothetical protein
MSKRNNKKKPMKKKTGRVVRRPNTYGNRRSDYSATAPPTAYGGLPLRKEPLPMFLGSSGMMYVQNYEMVGSVTNVSGPAFSIQGFVCNPGLTTSFPWLAGMASSYQKFKFEFLRYLYIPAVPTTTSGNSWLYLEYDYEDAGPTSLAEVAVSNEASICPVWQGGAIDPEIAFRRGLSVRDIMHVDVDVKNLSQPWYYVRDTQEGVSPSSGGALSGTIPVGLGFTPGSIADSAGRPVTLYYGTNGVANTVSTAGYLYVAYKVIFSSPTSPAIQG